LDEFRPVILIPAFRESRTIGRVVSEATKFAPVIVVDDCSDDGTAEVAESAGASVIRNRSNLGYIGGLNVLFSAALSRSFTHAITMDADGEHDPARLGTFIELLRGQRCRMVLGVRPKTQRLAEAVTAVYVRWRFGISDVFCGMKGYDLALVRENGGFDQTQSVGTELAIKAARRGVPFSEAPVGGTPRVDAPRFGRRWRANMQLFSVLGRIVRDDIRYAFSPRKDT
jgi:glycosyltransferase involved in cell wall biosynthesis